MGPKRKGNRNSRGGKGSGKVASRVALFEAAANTNNAASRDPKPNDFSAKKLNGTLEGDKSEKDLEPKTSEEDQPDSAEILSSLDDVSEAKSPSALEQAEGEDTTERTAETPNDVEKEENSELEHSEHSELQDVENNIEKAASITHESKLVEGQEDPKSKADGFTTESGSVHSNSDPSVGIKCADLDLNNADQDVTTNVSGNGTAEETLPVDPSSEQEESVQKEIVDASLEPSEQNFLNTGQMNPETSDKDTLTPGDLEVTGPDAMAEEPADAVGEVESIQNSHTRVRVALVEVGSTASSLEEDAANNSGKDADETSNTTDTTTDIAEGEVDPLGISGVADSTDLVKPRQFLDTDSKSPQLDPSPLPDTDTTMASDDEEVEIIETQNITRVGGANPVRVKPVLVTATPVEFTAGVDPSTYFADPDDTVVEEASTRSPHATMSAQRVRVVAGGLNSPSTTGSAHMVDIGRSSPPPLPEKVPVTSWKDRGGNPPASSLSEDAEIIGVAVVGFHHTRGPEVEYWVGPDGDQSELWPYLPFQSLPDGSHSFEESVCYFTLLYDRKTHRGPNPTPQRDEEGHIIDSSDFNDVTTLFAVSCSRQVATADLENAPADATRSSIHKSIVVIARKPVFGSIKEKLTVVTRSYFEQGQFEDRQIIDRFYENLVHLFSLPQSDSDFQVGISVRDFVYRFGADVMIMFKALLMEKRILFFASDTDLLCTFQFALISLIPNLLNHLEDCGSPLLSNYETNLVKPTYMQSSNRDSMLKFMGLPLHVFAAGGIFNPFVPLQQLDELTRKETQYGLFGSTNQLFLSASKADIIVDIDHSTVQICNQDLKSALALSSADKAFMQPITAAVVKSWDSDNKWQPRSLGYLGSDDYLRQQFEDYLLGLLASVKYESYLQRLGPEPPQIFTRDFAPNPLKAFNMAWATQWKQTNNYRIFNKFTDDELFDIVEPAHVATIKNRPRIDAFAEPPRDVPPKGEKVKGFFSGLFKRSSTTSVAGTSETSAAPDDDATPRASPTSSVHTAAAGDSESVAESIITDIASGNAEASVPATPDATEASDESPLSPRRLMFWR